MKTKANPIKATKAAIKIVDVLKVLTPEQQTRAITSAMVILGDWKVIPIGKG